MVTSERGHVDQRPAVARHANATELGRRLPGFGAGASRREVVTHLCAPRAGETFTFGGYHPRHRSGRSAVVE